MSTLKNALGYRDHVRGMLAQRFPRGLLPPFVRASLASLLAPEPPRAYPPNTHGRTIAR